MILRNYASSSIRVLMPADNRPQTTAHLKFKTYLIPLLMTKRIIRKIKSRKEKIPSGCRKGK